MKRISILGVLVLGLSVISAWGTKGGSSQAKDTNKVKKVKIPRTPSRVNLSSSDKAGSSPDKANSSQQKANEVSFDDIAGIFSGNGASQGAQLSSGSDQNVQQSADVKIDNNNFCAITYYRLKNTFGCREENGIKVFDISHRTLVSYAKRKMEEEKSESLKNIVDNIDYLDGFNPGQEPPKELDKLKDRVLDEDNGIITIEGDEAFQNDIKDALSQLISNRSGRHLLEKFLILKELKKLDDDIGAIYRKIRIKRGEKSSYVLNMAVVKINKNRPSEYEMRIRENTSSGSDGSKGQDKNEIAVTLMHELSHWYHDCVIGRYNCGLKEFVYGMLKVPSIVAAKWNPFLNKNFYDNFVNKISKMNSLLEIEGKLKGDDKLVNLLKKSGYSYLADLNKENDTAKKIATKLCVLFFNGWSDGEEALTIAGVEPVSFKFDDNELQTFLITDDQSESANLSRGEGLRRMLHIAVKKGRVKDFEGIMSQLMNTDFFFAPNKDQMNEPAPKEEDEVEVGLTETERVQCYKFLKKVAEKEADIDNNKLIAMNFELWKNVSLTDNVPIYSAIIRGDLELVKQLKNSSSASLGELHMAIWYGHLEIVEYLVEKGADVNAKDKKGQTPLYFASWQGHSAIVKYLVKKGADVNAKDKKGQTPLHIASEYGWLEIVEYLVEEGADVNAKDDRDYTPLHWASTSGHLDIVKYLVKKGAKVNAEADEGETPLHWASMFGHLEIVKHLVENEADVNAEDKEGVTPFDLASVNGKLYIADYLLKNGAVSRNIQEVKDSVKNYLLRRMCEQGQIDGVKYLVEKGAKVDDKKGQTPLHIASGNGYLDIVKYLVEKKADVNAKDGVGNTPLHWASFYGHLEIVEYLAEKGAKIEPNDIIKNANKDIKNYLVQQACIRGEVDTLKKFVDICECDVNTRDKEGNTPLHWASFYGHLDIVKYLVEKKADVNAKANDGVTSLHLASGNGYLEIVKYLVATEKVDVNAKAQADLTPLHFASGKGHLEIVKYLVETGKVDVNAKDQAGLTPLHWVSMTGNSEIVKYLVETGKADVNATDTIGLTPLHFASQNGYLDIVQYLVDKSDPNKKQEYIKAKNENGWTPLHFASQNGHLDIVQYLVEECHANIEATDNVGMTPLHFASQNGHLDIVKYLVEKSDPNKKQEYIEAKDNDGKTPLYIAAEKGHLEVFKYLRENKAKIESNDIIKNANDNIKNYCLQRACEEGQQKAVEYLVKNGANVNDQDNDGRTPLYIASMAQNLGIVKYLVKNGADVNAKDNDGMTSLHVASMVQNSGIVEYLVETGKADVNAKDNNDKTPLHVASMVQNSGIVEYLVEHGANVNAKDRDGRTPADVAGTDKIKTYLQKKQRK